MTRYITDTFQSGVGVPPNCHVEHSRNIQPQGAYLVFSFRYARFFDALRMTRNIGILPLKASDAVAAMTAFVHYLLFITN